MKELNIGDRVKTSDGKIGTITKVGIIHADIRIDGESIDRVVHLFEVKRMRKKKAE